GPGLPDAARASVFERFVSLDGHGGSGLGLPIARGLAEAQGGHLDYEDDSFVLTLPARPVQALLAA
ncbi:MAG TPA: ATP-binding protein, partial [Acidimicrobiales bacterium]|nr:ATP-binding protein [Acidimicrobiales bacterium]